MIQKKPQIKGQVKVTQTSSFIGKPDIQRRILVGLGLRKIGKSMILENTPSIQGMITKVKHLINVETL